MPLATLEEIRLLSNLETGKEKLLQIVLFGQPELDEHLNLPHMRQLKERITHAFRPAPLPPRDIKDYINFRLRAAGYHGPDLFGPEALAHHLRRFRGPHAAHQHLRRQDAAGGLRGRHALGQPGPCPRRGLRHADRRGAASRRRAAVWRSPPPRDWPSESRSATSWRASSSPRRRHRRPAAARGAAAPPPRPPRRARRPIATSPAPQRGTGDPPSGRRRRPASRAGKLPRRRRRRRKAAAGLDRWPALFRRARAPRRLSAVGTWSS